MRNLQLGSLLWCHLFVNCHVSIENWTHVLWKCSQCSQQLSRLFWLWVCSLGKSFQFFERLCCAAQYSAMASLLSLRPPLLHLRPRPWQVRWHCPPGSKPIVPDQGLEDKQCLCSSAGWRTKDRKEWGQALSILSNQEQQILKAQMRWIKKRDRKIKWFWGRLNKRFPDNSMNNSFAPMSIHTKQCI